MDLLSQHEAFLRAIFDAPDDDTPRLVYADFLEENGEADRAAFIRWQCGHGPEPASVPESMEIGRFDRGFPAPWKTMTVSLAQLRDPGAFRRHLALRCPAAFAVEGVMVCDGRITSADPFDAIFSLAAFARVTELNLEGDFRNDEDGGLGIVYSIEPVITAAGVVALAGHRGMRRLTSLVLTNNDLDNDAARALVKSPYLGNLKHLQLLEGNRLRGRVWQQVVARFGEDAVG